MKGPRVEIRVSRPQADESRVNPYQPRTSKTKLASPHWMVMRKTSGVLQIVSSTVVPLIIST